MRPRRLTVRGFTCFRDEVTIDFTNLELFAITGPTGAGKTSILDAMTLALYGRVYRVEGVRSVISLGAKEMRVHFEFSVGAAVYRVTRVGFAGTRASQVGLDRALGNGEWEALAKGARDAEERVVSLLGLDFEGFTKAVLLPQNAFFRFLQGEPSERRSILEALLGLEIYERIQRRANHVSEIRRQEADLLGQQLARDYQDVTLERLHELEETTRVAAERVIETRATREATTGALGIVRDVVRCRSQAHALVSESANLGIECEDLERQIRAVDTTLSDLDVAIATVDAELGDTAYDDSRHLLLGRLEPHAVRREQIVERLSTLDQDTVAHAAALKAAQEEHASRQKDLLSAQSVLATRREDLETVERRASDLEKQYGTSATIASLQQTERQAREDQHTLEGLDDEIRGLEDREAVLRDDIERLRVAATTEEAVLRIAEVEKAEAERRAGTLRELEAAVEGSRRRMGEVARELVKTDEAAAAKRLVVDTAEREAATAEQNAETSRDALAKAEAILADLKFDNAAYVLRSRLAAGLPCPVCEQYVGEPPELHAQHSVAEAEAAVMNAKAKVRTAQNAAQRATQSFTRVQTELATIESSQTKLEADLERLNQELADLLPADLVGQADNIAARRKDAEAAVTAAEQPVAAARAAVTRAGTDLARLEGELKALPSIASKRKSRAALQVKCKTAADAINRVCKKPPGDEAAGALTAIANALNEAAAARAKAANAVSPAATAVHELQLRCQRLAQQVTSEEQAQRTATGEIDRLTREQQRVEHALETAGFPLDGRVLETIRTELRRLSEAKLARDRLLTKRAEVVAKHSSVQEETAVLRGRFAERVQQRAAVVVKAGLAQQEATEASGRLTAAIAAQQWPGWQEAAAAGTEEPWLTTLTSRAQKDYETAVAEHTTLSTEVRSLGARLELANACRTRYAEAQREANVATDVGQLLMANRFRSYLLEEAIRTLAADGSVHLKELSAGRYTFHNDGAEFQIVDSWNADERRSVKTLSGGETFLASLALALGLAEGLPTIGAGEHGHQRLESLFIDEGFGTLDPDETLDIVTQALENLRTDERIVGIVTHLPQLAERLPAQIRVVKTQLGSHVEISGA